jgi:signal transduction histidine kinase
VLHGMATGGLRGRSSGAFILLPRRDSLSMALPVPRQACLGLARAVLARRVGDGAAGAGSDPRLWLLAGGDPAIAVWLASWEREAFVHAAAGRSGVDGGGRVRPAVTRGPAFSPLAALAGAFSIPGPRDPIAVVDEPSWEAFVGGVLAEAPVPAAGSASPLAVDASLLESLRDRGRGWLARIEAGELAGVPPSGLAGESPAPEALLAVEAVAMAAAHAELVGRFDAGVAEARLEAMRELAYGAGHEINNPLANIATRAQALLLDESDPERRRRLATIVDQSFRARDMIGGLMLFARPPKPKLAAAEAGGIVAAVVESIEAQAATRGVKLEFAAPVAAIEVTVDRVQIEEAIRAIAVNALEAVEQTGTVTLAAFRRSAADGEWCDISVVDGGRGMDGETMRRAFDPFFSGREAGRGAGLGLSKAWRLIEANGGDVVLESRPGQGTQVTVTLPLAR